MAKYTVSCSWDDVPHLSTEQKAEYEAAYLPHEREARTRGFPSVGAGKIFPIPESDFVINPFEIPSYWPRVYALDVGFKRTAAVWGAMDPTTETWYIYDEYYAAEQQPPIHAAAIRAKGKWIPGVIDPSSMRGNERDGRKLIFEYQGLGLEDLHKADNSVEVGITRILLALSSGTLKVFLNCQNWLAEYRIYRYNDRGEVARNQEDHLMDATRYLKNSGQRYAKCPPDEFNSNARKKSPIFSNRDDITGC